MTDAELNSIRAAWSWAKPTHSVKRLLAYIDELREKLPIVMPMRADPPRGTNPGAER